MNGAKSESPLSDLSRMLGDLVDEGMRVGMDLMETLGRSRLPDLAGSLQKVAPASRRCGCEIPPPCWMPKALGDLTSHVCPGGAATVRIVVTNCSMTPRAVQVDAAGADGGKVKITPAGAVSIAPMDQATFVATLAVPADAPECGSSTALLWVRGCHLHHLRWTVDVRSRGGHACHEVQVHDCPDLVHHWYDHFYCPRPCPHGGRVAGVAGTSGLING
jgi:hypothetical protein